MIKAFPSDAVIDRKMFKADKNTNILVNNVDVLALFISLVLFPSRVEKFAIVLGRWSVLVQVLRDPTKYFQLVDY